LELAFSIFREIKEVLLRLWRQQALPRPLHLYTNIHGVIFRKTDVFKDEVVTSWRRHHDFTKIAENCETEGNGLNDNDSIQAKLMDTYK
jgi:hypothetical protein